MIAIVSNVGDVVQVVTKNKNTVSNTRSFGLVFADQGVFKTSKRELTLVDRSNSSIRLTLWGGRAEAYKDHRNNLVIALKGVKVGEFQGKTQLLS